MAGRTPRKIGYARVSTSDQNLDMQVDALKRYGIPEELIFTDTKSGAAKNRPGFIEALRFAQIPETEFVVWKLDRLGRTLTGILQVMELLRERGVIFVSLTEHIDTRGAMGKAMFHLMAVFAEVERDLIRERTMAGLKRHRERGGNHGRPAVMIPERVAKAKELIAEGLSGAEIWRVVRKIEGPKLSRSAYYLWQRKNDIQEKLST